MATTTNNKFNYVEFEKEYNKDIEIKATLPNAKATTLTISGMKKGLRDKKVDEKEQKQLKIEIENNVGLHVQKVAQLVNDTLGINYPQRDKQSLYEYMIVTTVINTCIKNEKDLYNSAVKKLGDGVTKETKMTMTNSHMKAYKETLNKNVAKTFTSYDDDKAKMKALYNSFKDNQVSCSKGFRMAMYDSQKGKFKSVNYFMALLMIVMKRQGVKRIRKETFEKVIPFLEDNMTQELTVKATVAYTAKAK